jgi:hypothetical protein
MVGPFGLPELAALFAVVLVLLVVPFLIPSQVPSLVSALISVVLAAIVATEAYIRAMPSRSRRAFEAFSWLGEWELGQVRRATGGGVPKTGWAARRWLRSHPERPEDGWFRVEVLLLADDLEGAHELADGLPDGTPEERFERASAQKLVDWRSGGSGTLDAVEAAAAALESPDGDAHLRAEVSIAAARVRRLWADPGTPPGAALEPLLEARQRLGLRADGQVGRALRRRILPVAIVGGLAIMVILRFATGSIGD